MEQARKETDQRLVEVEDVVLSEPVETILRSRPLWVVAPVVVAAGSKVAAAGEEV
jgi:hypothetical protein